MKFSNDNEKGLEKVTRFPRKLILLAEIVIFASFVYASFVEDTDMSITGLKYSSQAWGDYNNDGNMDLVVCGTDGYLGGTATTYTRAYTSNGSVLTEDTNQSIINASECSLNFGDIDNDGYLDLVVAGRYDETTANTTIYLYNGSNFVRNQNLAGVRFGSTHLADLDNDGDLDLIISGCSEFIEKKDYYCSTNITEVYLNNAGIFTNNSIWAQNLSGVWKSSIALADYDNDGDLDLALTGKTDNSTSFSDAVTKLYRNNGTAFTYDPDVTLEGIYWGSIAWDDFDQDNDVDLFMTGKNESGDRITKIFTTDTALDNPNTQPTAPTTLSSVYGSGQLNLSWNDGSDNETNVSGLYYNLRAGSNSTANNIFSGKNAISSNPTQGYFGNMMQMKNKTLNIPQRCVFYSVQTIDTSLKRSNWSTIANYSSNEICNTYDNDCDLSVDEGYDMDNDGSIAYNETFDKDGDGYYPNETVLFNSTGGNNETYLCSNYAEYDCDDNDNTSYPGSACTRSGYSGAYWQWNSISMSCDCVGGIWITNVIGSGGSGRVITITPEETPEEITKETKETGEAQSPSEEGGMGSDESKTLFDEITDKRYKITREVTITGSGTKITETIKALDLFGLEDVKLTIELPKTIEESASNLVQIDKFTIIEDDPIIEFDLGVMEPLETKKVQYAIRKRLSRSDLDTIIANLSLKDEDREAELRQQVEETQRYVNITQDINVNYEENQTEFTIKVDYDDTQTVVGDVYIYTEIPKCLVEIIKDELIESEYDYEIVAEDPLIVWHFNSLLDVEEINYNIKAISDEDCANQAKATAIAKKIVQVRFSPKKSNILLVLSIIPIIIFIMFLFGAFSKEIKHYDPKIQKLIKYVKHHYKHGFKEHHLREKLLEQGYKLKDIVEAMKLNSKNKMHYWIQKLEIGFEELILITLIVLNILDFTELLPGDADYAKKIISWSILAFLLYRVSITKLLMGVRKKWVDLTLIFAFFMLILKNMVGFANAAFIETTNQGALVTDLYAYIIQNNQLFEVYFFIAGIIILTIVSFYLAFIDGVKDPSFLGILHFHPKHSNNPFKILMRFIVTKTALLAFFIVIFNLMMEWLAIAVDALILVITIGFVFMILIKHRERFTPPQIMQDIAETSEKFYEKFINLFKYKRYIMIGAAGLLILHILTELGNFLVPYLTGIHDAIYFGNFYEGHLPIFNLFSSGTRSLFELQSAGLGLQMQALIWIGYFLNIIAALYLILLPTYMWYHMFKNRKQALNKIPILKMNEFHIFLSTTSIAFLFLNPVFIIESIRKVGLVGVDVQTTMLNLTNLNQSLMIALGIGVLALFISLKFTSFVKKTIMTISTGFFLYYIYLFFENTMWYYVTSIKELFSVQTFITFYLAMFLIINALFYLSGIFSMFFELYIRKELWFEGTSISWIDNYKKQHKYEFIHHPDTHAVDIHGKKEEKLERYIKKHMLHGEHLLLIKEHLINRGWDKTIVNRAAKDVLKDEYIMEFVNQIDKEKNG